MTWQILIMLELLQNILGISFLIYAIETTQKAANKHMNITIHPL